MTGLEVRRAGRLVQVWYSKMPAEPQKWSVDEWAELVAAIKWGTRHVGVDKDPVLPLVIFGLYRHDPLYVDLDDWRPFVAGVKAGKFDIDKLSSGDAASPVSADGAVRVVAGAGKAGNPPSAPAATEAPPVDVPAGRPTPAAAQVVPPQEAGRPGPGRGVNERVREIVTYQVRRGGLPSEVAGGILADLRTEGLLVDEAPRWGSGPLVNHVDSESSRIGVAAGGGEAGPGSPPVGPGPAEPSAVDCADTP